MVVEVIAEVRYAKMQIVMEEAIRSWISERLRCAEDVFDHVSSRTPRDDNDVDS
jgi:hypothetical protein